MSWWELVPQIAAYTTLLIAFGTALIVAAGATRLSQLLYAPLAACAALGALSLVSVWVPWSPATVAAGSALAVAAVLAMRRAFEGGPLRRNLREQLAGLAAQASGALGAKAAWAALGTAASATLAFSMAALWVGSPQDVLQQYDNPFHYSVVRHIVETGAASPIGAGSVAGSAGAVYPDLWHALAALDMQLFGATIQEAAWAISIAAIGVVSPLGMVALVRRLFPDAAPVTLGLAALAPTIVPMSAPTYVAFGSLYANLLGLALLPGAIALVSQALGCRGGHLSAMARAAAVAACALALGFAHPSTAFVVAIFMLALLVARSRSWAARAGFAILFAVIWAALMASPLFARTINCLDRIASSTELGGALVSAAGLDYATVAASVLPAAGATAIVAFSAVAAFLLRKRWRASWYLVGLGVVAAQIALSFFPELAISRIATGFWYRDAPRLSVIFVLLASPLAAALPALAYAALSKAPEGIGRRASRCALVALCLAACCLLAVKTNSYYGRQFADLAALPNSSDDASRLTAAQADFSRTIAEIAGDDVVLNNNQDGSVWLYPIYDANALIKSRPANQMTSMPDDLYTVMTRIAEYGEEGSDAAEVRAAAARLDLAYVVQMSDAESMTTRFNELDQIDYAPAGPDSRIDESTPGFELVAEQDGMRLYRLLPAV